MCRLRYVCVRFAHTGLFALLDARADAENDIECGIALVALLSPVWGEIRDIINLNPLLTSVITNNYIAMQFCVLLYAMLYTCICCACVARLLVSHC